MIETLITFALALGVILLAQVAESRRWARWLLNFILLALGGVLLILGLVILMEPSIMNKAGKEVNGVGSGWMLIATALFILLPVLAAMLLRGRGRDPVIRGVPWTRPVHLTAWTLLTTFIGSNFAIALMGDLSELDLEEPLTLILTQNAAFVLAALLGVGWGVRRNWREVVQRLGLKRPTLNEFLIGAGMALVMLLVTGIVGGLVALIFGEDMIVSTEFNEQILNQLPGVWGILLMGLATGVGEELLYRGALQPVVGLWLTSLLFAISHIQYLSPAILVIFALGALLGWTRNRWGVNTAIWSHAVYNSLVGFISLLAANLDQFTSGM